MNNIISEEYLGTVNAIDPTPSTDGMPQECLLHFYYLLPGV